MQFLRGGHPSPAQVIAELPTVPPLLTGGEEDPSSLSHHHHHHKTDDDYVVPVDLNLGCGNLWESEFPTEPTCYELIAGGLTCEYWWCEDCAGGWAGFCDEACGFGCHDSSESSSMDDYESEDDGYEFSPPAVKSTRHHTASHHHTHTATHHGHHGGDDDDTGFEKRKDSSESSSMDDYESEEDSADYYPPVVFTKHHTTSQHHAHDEHHGTDDDTPRLATMSSLMEEMTGGGVGDKIDDVEDCKAAMAAVCPKSGGDECFDCVSDHADDLTPVCQSVAAEALMRMLIQFCYE